MNSNGLTQCVPYNFAFIGNVANILLANVLVGVPRARLSIIVSNKMTSTPLFVFGVTAHGKLPINCCGHGSLSYKLHQFTWPCTH